MGLGRIGLAAADKLERSVGAQVALRSYKALLSGDDREVVAQAALGAIRCAVALGDGLELAAMCAYWETLIDARQGAELEAMIRARVAAGDLEAAAAMSRAEATRRPSGRMWYWHARVLEGAGKAHVDAYRRAAELGEGAVRTAAQCKLLEAALHGDDAFGLAESIDLSTANAAQKLLVAEVRLGGSSRFGRAAALSLLEEVARSHDGAAAKRAVHVAAVHADVRGDDLTWVEADRVAVALAAWPIPHERDDATARMTIRRRLAAEGNEDAVLRDAAKLVDGYRLHFEQARATLAGHAIEGTAAADHPELVLVERCLRASLEIRRSAWRAAELAVREVLVAQENDVDLVSRPMWTVVYLALSCGERRVELTGLELLSAIAGRLDARAGSAISPPLGWLALARTAQFLHADDLAERLLRFAERQQEPGSRDALADALSRRGWQAHARGDAERAQRCLREARSLSDTQDC